MYNDCHVFLYTAYMCVSHVFLRVYYFALYLQCWVCFLCVLIQLMLQNFNERSNEIKYTVSVTATVRIYPGQNTGVGQWRSWIAIVVNWGRLWQCHESDFDRLRSDAAQGHRCHSTPSVHMVETPGSRRGPCTHDRCALHATAGSPQAASQSLQHTHTSMYTESR